MIVDILFLLLGVFASILALVRQYQMLQQNSYFLSRYFGWLKTSFSPFNLVLRLVLAGLVIAAAIFGIETFIESLLLFSGGALYFGWKAYLLNSKSIKKLVLTARVKRMFVFSVLFLLGIITASVLTGGPVQIILLAFLYLLIFNPELITIISLLVLKPLEKAISNHFVNDAKRILASKPSLKVIGITGSYGKTGTKYILSRILSEKYNVLHTPESFNTPMGVVRTIREKMRADTEISARFFNP